MDVTRRGYQVPLGVSEGDYTEPCHLRLWVQVIGLSWSLGPSQSEGVFLQSANERGIPPARLAAEPFAGSGCVRSAHTNTEALRGTNPAKKEEGCSLATVYLSNTKALAKLRTTAPRSSLDATPAGDLSNAR